MKELYNCLIYDIIFELEAVFIVEGIEWERESVEVLLDNREEFSGGLVLELVGGLKGSLVDASLDGSFLGLALRSGDNHVEAEDISVLEGSLVDFLVEGGVVDDGLNAVNDVSLHSVGEDAFHGGHLVGVADSSDGFGHIVVVVLSGVHDSHGSLHGVVGGKDHIGGLSSNGLALVADHNSVGHNGGETVDMHSEVDLGHVAFGKDCVIVSIFGILVYGWEVAANFVKGNTGGESHSLDKFLLSVNFGEGLFDEGVSLDADLVDGSARLNEG